jgi:predicted nucleic acid-binding protein
VIVLDASVAVEVVLGTQVGERILPRLYRRGETLHAPHLLDLEVIQVLRRYVALRMVREERAAGALRLLLDLPLRRYAHDALAERIWQLRRNLTAYDAAYVALAEALRAPLLTADARLAAAPGHKAEIELA